MALNVGSRLGHYDVTALIGEGGMGQVYQARDTKLDRDVALKVLRRTIPAGANDMIERLDDSKARIVEHLAQARAKGSVDFGVVSQCLRMCCMSDPPTTGDSIEVALVLGVLSVDELMLCLFEGEELLRSQVHAAARQTKYRLLESLRNMDEKASTEYGVPVGDIVSVVDLPLRYSSPLSETALTIQALVWAVGEAKRDPHQ